VYLSAEASPHWPLRVDTGGVGNEKSLPVCPSKPTFERALDFVGKSQTEPAQTWIATARYKCGSMVTRQSGTKMGRLQRDATSTMRSFAPIDLRVVGPVGHEAARRGYASGSLTCNRTLSPVKWPWEFFASRLFCGISLWQSGQSFQWGARRSSYRLSLSTPLTRRRANRSRRSPAKQEGSHFPISAKLKGNNSQASLLEKLQAAADASMEASPIYPIFIYFAAAVRGLAPVTFRRR
jgi:hypothetical protein